MPFQSKSQMRWMFANHPSMAKRWAKHTEDAKGLPEKKKDSEEKKAYALVDQYLMGEIVKQAVNIATSKPLNVKTTGNSTPTNTGSSQYGANLQQAVKTKVQQMQQPASNASPVKSAFLSKLAAPPAAITPAQPTQPPVAQPAPPKWVGAMQSGQGGFELPVAVRNRLTDTSPEMQQKLQSLWHVRANLPQQEKTVLNDPEALLYPEHINRMAGQEQTDFLEHAKENMPSAQYQKAFGTGQAPHYFEALRGSGTPEQQQAAKNYAQQQYNWMDQSRQNIIPTHKARQLAHSDEMSKEVGDIALKNTIGFNTKNLDALSGANWDNSSLGEKAYNSAAIPGGAAVSLGGMLIPGLSGFRAAGSAPKAMQAAGKFFAPFQYGNVAGRAAEAAGATPEVQNVAESAVSTGAAGLSTLKNLARGITPGAGRSGNRFLGYGQMSPATAVDAGLTGYFGSKIPGEAEEAFNAPKTPQEAQSQGFRKALTEGEPTENQLNAENLPQPSLGVDAGQALARQFSPQFSGTNTAPAYGQLGNKVTGIPGYYAASTYEGLGPVSQSPEGVALDKELAEVRNLPNQEQGQALTAVDQKIQNTYGVGIDEYRQFKTTNMALANARKDLDKSIAALDQHTSSRAGGAVDPSFSENVRKATIAYDQLNQNASKTLTPIMTKVLDHRFKQEIAPMEQDLGEIGQMSKAISDKIANNQPLDDADMAVIEKGKKYVNTIRDFSFDKAKLEFMRNGNLSDPKIAKLFDDKGEQNLKTLNSMFSGNDRQVVGPDGQPILIDVKDETGKVIGKQPMTENNNPLINAAKKNFINAVDEASGGQITQEQQQQQPAVGNAPAPASPPAAPAAPGAPGATQNQAPGMFQSFVENVWNKLGDTQKQVTFAGLGLAALGMLSMFMGDDDDDEEGGSGLGGLLTILGIGLGVGPSLMQHFGLGGTTPPAAPATPPAARAPAAGGAPPAGGAETPQPAPNTFKIEDIRAAAQTDPNKAADLLAEAANSNKNLKDSLNSIGLAASFGWKDSPLFGKTVDAKYIAEKAKANGVPLTEQDAQMLKDNWPLISSKLR
jgi:hypothetical protein